MSISLTNICKTSFKIKGREGSQFYLVISANSLEKLTLPRRKKKNAEWQK